jgi:hypothetical protein
VTEKFRKGGTDPQTAELPGPRSRPWYFYLGGIVESSVGILLTWEVPEVVDGRRSVVCVWPICCTRVLLILNRD